jgi:hypothetical protein
LPDEVDAYGDMSNIRTAMNRGAFDFVTKPIDFQDLETTIAKTLRHIELLRDARQRQAVAERAYASLSRYFSPNLARELACDTDAIHIAVGGDHDDRDIRSQCFGLGQEFKTAHPRHVDVGQDQDESTVACIGDALKCYGGGLGKLHGEPASAKVVSKLLSEQNLDIGLIVDHENEHVHARSPDLLKGFTRARQNDPKFGEFAGLRIDLNRPTMLLDDDVVTDRQAQPSPFTGGLCRKERVEQLLLHLGRDAGAVVAYPDFDAVAEALGRGNQCGLVIAPIGFHFALGRGIEAVGDQVEQHPRDLLREQINLTGGGVKGPLQGDIKALLLRPRPVIGELLAGRFV